MITIRAMHGGDFDLGLRLCRQAGWNQVQSDWRRFLALQPDGCFVAEVDAVPVATTTTCIFGPVAWIAMVLVEVGARRRGVATALLNHALRYLDGQGVQTVRLDATPAGMVVYEKLGFVPEYSLTRYEGVAPPADPQSGVAPAVAGHLAEVVALDFQATGTWRERMFAALFTESLPAVRVMFGDGGLEGFVAARLGANATQIGPCIAHAHAGPALLRDALGSCAGRPVFLDIPRDNAEACRLAEMSGLRIQRHFTRMCRGRRIRDHVEAIWASSGPEKG
jgi:GNAT superfamily N-acetyltransferase